MTADLIETQNRIAYLKKKIRDLQGELKRHEKDLKELSKYNWSAADIARSTQYHNEEMEKLQANLKEVEPKLAELEKLRPQTVPFEGVLDFFQGNNLDNARFALELVAASIEKGFWVPGASRRVRAALNESRTAKKLLVKSRFKKEMEPIEELMKAWDMTRPIPTFTELGASPTVTAEWKRQDAKKVEFAPGEWVKVEEVDQKTGKVIGYRYAWKLRWPKGTLHGTSRYWGTGRNAQCEACGHAIKNPYNWVSLLITTNDGTLKSLYVGRDCAKNLFGIEMTGELELKE